ncbi:hypothetical protein CRE_25956 [Caenorhabditis remanei]|uniref:Uncharacterized protein n=3 Tax=Caenorhabditis TaxID=6237 RepID=E3NGC9_CAERE|nr:hypothetical protein CRE_25879 [Caenorhabditis remanei]EFP06054.1 hypothetical protein CRE_25956 [Caenorhabditis remanei]
MEMAKFLNVFLTVEQVVAVEKLLAIGVPPINIVRLLQSVSPNQQMSPGNRENGI